MAIRCWLFDLQIDGVLAVHEFHVWRLVGECIIATVHIKFSDLRAYLNAADQIRTLFHNNAIHSTTIQPEFAEVITCTLCFGDDTFLAAFLMTLVFDEVWALNRAVTGSQVCSMSKQTLFLSCCSLRLLILGKVRQDGCGFY